MNIEDVTLSAIAVACLLFDSVTPYNVSLANFRKATRYRLDLHKQGHRDALLKWLNDWGCRHLAENQHEVASKSILDWYQRNISTLFSDKTPIWQLECQQIETAADAYGSLKDRLGASRFRRGNQARVPIGPTAASKILFAIRPKALMPWDDAMRKSFECDDGSPISYARYLGIVRSITLHVAHLCRSKGFEIDDLPKKTGRPGSTVVDLLNEYIWIKTRGADREIELPSSETLTHWASLG